MKIAIIGKGKLGSALDALCRRYEHDVVLLARDWRDSLSELNRADLVVIAVNDATISQLATELATVLTSPSINVIHCSGSHPSECALQALRTIGISTASAHPVFAFSSVEHSLSAFANSYTVIEGESRATEMADRLFTSLGAKTLVAASVNKHQYHAATVFASNLIVAQLSTAIELAARSGLDKEDAQALLCQLAINNLRSVANSSPERALTGPISRGDVDTISAHLSSLNSTEIETYKTLSKIALTLAQNLTSEQIAQLKSLLA
jgi:predicted short-subunit dehydrogenase-like oxidoreductase (DUF2520 family)